MSDDDLINSLEQIRFKDFEEFRKTVLKTNTVNDFDYDDLSLSELKSKAVLGEIEEQNPSYTKYNVTLKTLLRALPTLEDYDENISYGTKNVFWSKMAGELNDGDAEKLVAFLDKFYHLKRYDRVPTYLTLNFALKNEVAWNAYAQDFMDDFLDPASLLYALRDVSEIKEQHLPLLKKRTNLRFYF